MEPLVNFQTSTIGEIARFNSNTISVFRKYGIDFYCQGKSLLSEACAHSQCDEKIVSEELKTALSLEVNEGQNFNDWSIDKLIGYIIDNHHQYVNKTVPEIAGLFKTIFAYSSVQSTDLTRAGELFRLLGNDMKQHMQKEELALFPAMKKLEAIINVGVNERTNFVPLQSLVSVVEMEHDTSGIVLKQLVTLQDRITATDYLTDDLSALISKLREFESDLIMHIHVENNVLHKKAIELEQSLMN